MMRETLHTLPRLLHRRLVLTALLLASILPAVAGPAVDAFVASPYTDPSSVSVIVVDLKSGKTVEAYNADKPLLPASITKALTIATTINSTDIDYRYRTGIFADGVIDGSTLRGNLYIKGSGDPSLNSVKEPRSRDFVAEVIDALEKKGIKQIEGTLVIDQSVFTQPATPPSWSQGDLAQAYGAGSFGFNYENNANGKASVRNPAALFEQRLRKAMAEKGIRMGVTTVPGGRRIRLGEHVSPPIDDIMRSCMRRSDNMFAETLLRTFALVNGKGGDTAAGARLEMDYWKRKGVNTAGVNIVDGSGLSRQNRMTTRFLSQVLQKMAGDVDYVSYFPLAGQEGTLSSFLKGTDLDSFIALKTGSMNGIQCYAGYKLDYNYAPTHVVVVMINNMTAERAKVRKEVEKMLLNIFKQ